MQKELLPIRISGNIKKARALTLVEILLALSILSLVMVIFYSSYSGIMTTIKASSARATASRKQTILYRMLEGDIQNVYYPLDPNQRNFHVEKKSRGNHAVDSLHFISLADDLSRVSKTGPLREVSYHVRENGRNMLGQPLFDLYRREQIGVDKDLEIGGVSSLLVKDIIAFKVECAFTKDKVEWIRECNFKDKATYPAGVRLTLVFPFEQDGQIRERSIFIIGNIMQDKPS